jgi:site-specific recombinase XerD
MRPRKPERSGRHSPERKQIEVRARRLRGIARELRRGDLRHSCASLLLAEGVHPRVVMETLGHSQISLTLDTYSVMVRFRPDSIQPQISTHAGE